MDNQTKELIEVCERHLLRGPSDEFADLARDDMPALIRALREHEKVCRALFSTVESVGEARQRLIDATAKTSDASSLREAIDSFLNETNPDR